MKPEEKRPITVAEEVTMVLEDFKYNLALLRCSQGKTGEELSLLLGFSKSRVNDLEQGRMPPKIEDIVAIIDYFDIDFNDLLDSRIGLNIKSHQ